MKAGSTVEESNVASLRARLRNRLNLVTDYDRRLRETWAKEWGRSLAKEAVVLDAGAGDTHLRHLLPGKKYVGVDVRPRASHVGKVRLCAGDVMSLPIRPSSVDHILCIEVLEHVSDPRQALFEFASVLRTGGTVCATVPQAGCEHEQPYDFFRFTTFSLQKLAQDTGFSVDEIRMKGGFFRRMSAELRDLPFVVFPEDQSYRWNKAALLTRWALVGFFTFVVATLLLPLDRFDRSKVYTTGYFVILRKS